MARRDRSAFSTVFSGRRALVTGAASGIGLATSLELALRGAALTMVDVDAERLTAAALDLPRRVPDASVQTRIVDVADAAAVDALAADVLAGGGVDILVNNAGVAVIAPFAETAQADWKWLSGVNLEAPLRLTRALLPSMVARGSGHVVLVASLAGLVGAPGMVAYTTTKFAIVGFAESLRLELAGTGVDVSVVCPGYVRTNLHAATRYGNDGFRRFLDDPPWWYGMEKEEVASSIADAVARRRFLVVLGAERMGYWLKRIAPGAAFALTKWVAQRTGTLPAPRARARADY